MLEGGIVSRLIQHNPNYKEGDISLHMSIHSFTALK
jgi:hypothetical protein